MLRKTITYTDYNGETRTEDFYFNLNKAEIIDWLTTSGNYTLDVVVDHLVKTRNTKEIVNIFKDLIYRSYGEKSLDGRRFIKSTEVKDGFIETEAYSVLFTELITDSSKAAEFFNAIIPADLAEEVEKAMAENPDGIPAEIRDYIPKKD